MKKSSLTRGNTCVLTKPVRKKSEEFKSKYIRDHVTIVPFYILSAIKANEKSIDRDRYMLAEHFMVTSHFDLYEKVVDELWDLAGHMELKNYPADKIMDMLYSGAMNFDKSSVYHNFHRKNGDLLKIYSPSILTLCRYMLNGSKDLDWYPNTLATFKKYLTGYDIELFTKIFAMTSPRTNFQSNLIIALKAYDLFQKNKIFSGKGFLPAVEVMLNDFRNGYLFFEKDCRTKRRKIINFANAILGDKDSVVIDSWLMKAYDLHQDYHWRGAKIPYSPRISEYDLIEGHIKALAKSCGYEPRQVVSMLWCGIRGMKSSFKTTDAASLLEKVLK